MKKPKALLSAILTCAILASAAVPAAADAVDVKNSEASVSAAQSSADGGDPSTFSWDNATVYFLLTDRFKNGDTSNDNAYGRQNIDVGDQRATFHGGDFAGITQKIEDGYFNDLGVNAIWLTAPYEQIHGYIQGGSNFYHYSYHGYYVLDYTQPDQAYGTKEEFKTLVDTAHKHGIRIVMDIVMNHAGYCSMYDMNEYGFGDLMSGWDTFYQNPNKSNAEEYQSYMGYTEDKSGNPNCAALWAKWWGPDWIRSDVAGYSLGTDGSELTQSLTGLPDFKTEQTTAVGIPPVLQTKWSQEGTLAENTAKYGSSNTVTGYITTWLSEWVREYGVDGFRCDTAKHVEKASWKKLKDSCVAALRDWKAANPDKKLDDLDFWMTGEHWDHGLGYDEYYSQGGFDSMINFSMSGGGALAASTLADTYQGYADQINSRDDFNALTFISSHDETLARGDMYYLGSTFLLLPGAVQIYYGDETNRPFVEGCPFDGNGGAGHSLRSDMNWDSIDEEILEHWQKVGTFRNNHIAVGGGSNVGLESTNGIAFGRTYDKNSIKDSVVCVVGADSNTDITIDVSDVFKDGVTLINTYDEETDTVTDGKVTFSSGAHGTILLEEGEPDPVRAQVKGGATFDTTEDINVILEGLDTALLTVDGIRKYTVKNGDTITIGDAAYPGDTVKVSLTYTHPVKGEVTKTFSFKKNDDGSGSSRSDNAIVHVYTSVGNATLYAWQETEPVTTLCGVWPGTALSAKDDDGWFVSDLGTTDKFNIIVNNGSDAGKSGDVTGLKGETWVVASDDFSVKTFTDKDKAYEAAGLEVVPSDYDNLKSVCREIKLLDPAEYTSSSLNAALEKVAEADKLILQGKDNADPAAVTAAYKEVVAAKEALVKGHDDTDEPTVDKTALKAKIDEAQKIIDEHTGPEGSDYMSLPLSNLMGAVSEAQKVYDDSKATQAEVDAQVTKLDDAIKEFNAPETDTSSDDDTDTSDDNTDTASDDTDTNSDDTDTASDIISDDTDSEKEDKPVTQPGSGDVNNDGKLSLKDASIIQKHYAGLVDLNDDQLAAADINGDGKVNLADAYVLQVEINKKFRIGNF